MALGTILVVVLAVLGALTALPAMLTLAAPRLARSRRRGTSGRRWGVAATAVTRRPALALAATLALLAVPLALATQLTTDTESLEQLPQDVAAVQAATTIAAAFPGVPAPARVVVEGDRLTTKELQAIGARGTTLTKTDGTPQVRLSADRRTGVVDVPMPAAQADRAQAVRDLRAGLPATAKVTGDTAEGLDFTDRMRDATPVVIGLVLGLAFLLIATTFRSAWLAAGVVALNLVSVGATYGVLVGVFQHGWLTGALGLAHTTAIVDWIPLFAFVILFGLSMDYTVLVLERVREARRSGLDARAAVAEGVARTAGAVTSAAAVMVTVFAVFATLRLVSMQQFGVGLATAVLLDATLVRAVALPAVLVLLGDRTGWKTPARVPAVATAAAARER